MTKWLEAARRSQHSRHHPKEPKEPKKPDEHTVNSVNSVNLDATGTQGAPATKEASTDSQAADACSSDHGDNDAADLDAYEERAAIRQYDGGQSRHEAEASALAEVAAALGLGPNRFRLRWYSDPDAQRYLGLVAKCGCLPLDAAADVLGWTLERTWGADARLRACGVLRDGRLVSANTFRDDQHNWQAET